MVLKGGGPGGRLGGVRGRALPRGGRRRPGRRRRADRAHPRPQKLMI